MNDSKDLMSDHYDMFDQLWVSRKLGGIVQWVMCVEENTYLVVRAPKKWGFWKHSCALWREIVELFYVLFLCVQLLKGEICGKMKTVGNWGIVVS